MNNKKYYITSEGYLKLVEERDQLMKIDRPEVVKIVSWAASNGDRSENADYQYGKRRLREIDRRLFFLNSRINTATVIDIAKQNGDIILFGATVTVVNDDEQQLIYKIVGVDEISYAKNNISYLSPIGSNLLGKKIGDIVNIKTPSGEIELEIISVKFC